MRLYALSKQKTCWHINTFCSLASWYSNFGSSDFDIVLCRVWNVEKRAISTTYTIKKNDKQNCIHFWLLLHSIDTSILLYCHSKYYYIFHQSQVSCAMGYNIKWWGFHIPNIVARHKTFQCLYSRKTTELNMWKIFFFSYSGTVE